jgi:hypothetical protein
MMVRILRRFAISEISAVDRPAQEHAKMVLMKRDAGGEPSIEVFAKMQIEGRGTGLEKHNYVDAIAKRAAELRSPSESDAQAFAKCIVDDDLGKLLYKAMKAAPGPEVKPEPEAKPEAPTFVGPAHAKMHAKAVELRRANPHLSFEGAYAQCYADRHNVALRKQVRDEHLAAVTAQANG